MPADPTPLTAEEIKRLRAAAPNTTTLTKPWVTAVLRLCAAAESAAEKDAEITALRQRAETAEAEAGRLRVDARRLDWLDEHEAAVWWVPEHSFWDYIGCKPQQGAMSLRDGIDAALAASQPTGQAGDTSSIEEGKTHGQ